MTAWPTSPPNPRPTGWRGGAIRVLGGVTEIRWDDVFGEIEVSLEPVLPEDLEIIGSAP